MTSVLFVCLGNICRSPLAEGTFRHLLEEAGLADTIICDSAGNGSWHKGDPPDPRAIAVAAKNGIDIRNQQSRPVHPIDFQNFEFILCMDRQNIKNLKRVRPAKTSANVDLFLNQALGQDEEVPDPYYGGADGFDRVFDQVMQANQALLEKLR